MTTPLRTPEQVEAWLDSQGLSKAEVARRFGVTCNMVHHIIRGRKPAKRGASHNIAVYLGLKAGVATAPKQTTRAARDLNADPVARHGVRA